MAHWKTSSIYNIKIKIPNTYQFPKNEEKNTNNGQLKENCKQPKNL